MPDVALEVSDLWYWYQDPAAAVLRGLHVRLPGGQFVALVGANGSGKTTLAKQFNGLLRPRRGSVRLAGQDTARRSVGELARQVGYLFQHPEHQIFATTVRREVAFGLENLGLPRDQIEARLEAALARFDLVSVAEQPPAILSYGLRRRVTLASLAAMAPAILVLDEPTVGLDLHGRRETLAWLAELHAAGRTILLITHDMTLVAEYAQRAIVLHEGQIIADAPPGDLFRQPDVLARANLVPPPVVRLAQAFGARGLPGQALSVSDFCDAYGAWLAGQRGGQDGSEGGA